MRFLTLDPNAIEVEVDRRRGTLVIARLYRRTRFAHRRLVQARLARIACATRPKALTSAAGLRGASVIFCSRSTSGQPASGCPVLFLSVD
jgi:hypothetical protein